MTYGREMAARYDRGRWLRGRDVDRWMAAARPYLPAAGGLVLDLGSGTGRFTAALGRSGGARVVACEPSAGMRAAFPRHAFPAGGVLVGGAAEAMPFRAGAFDAVWASQVLHHVRDLPAFAAGVRRVLRPGGHLLIRGGFGPVEELVLYPYFPLAWAAGAAVRLTAGRITGVLAGVDLAAVAHVQVGQTFAETAAELVDKVATRSLSPLAGLPDPAFRAGLAALRADVAAGRVVAPVLERLDLVVFRAPGRSRS